jgi:hypothetical protein
MKSTANRAAAFAGLAMLLVGSGFALARDDRSTSAPLPATWMRVGQGDAYVIDSRALQGDSPYALTGNEVRQATVGPPKDTSSPSGRLRCSSRR